MVRQQFQVRFHPQRTKSTPLFDGQVGNVYAGHLNCLAKPRISNDVEYSEESAATLMKAFPVTWTAPSHTVIGASIWRPEAEQ